ncbi:aminotransferase class IV [Desulfotomaculum copahuensis]|uniref:aminotransferase class IV n=1 Tax=Desulfotomaculum copahuensis TaxID=1838280 RepID=UPI0013737CD9|nr:aminotransferase class IV [Desulfotomaculum copahuensis]
MSAEQAFIPAADRGFLFGYGLFETVLINNARPVFWPLHRRRLAGGCAELDLTLPVAENELDHLVQETIDRNGAATGALRLSLSAGPAGGAGTLLLTIRPLPYGPAEYRRGFKACFAAASRNEKSPLVRLKTLNYLENLLARSRARRRGMDEALFLNTAGGLAEGSASNLFLVKNGCLITPDIHQGLLPGITRRAVLELCRELGLPAAERPVHPAELAEAGECFLTNSLLGVMPLVAVEGRLINRGRPGSWTEKIAAALNEQREIE